MEIDEKIENIFYNNIISPKLEDDILVIYKSTYSDLSLVDDLTPNEKQFLLTNFGNSLFYYQKFKKIKDENKFLNYYIVKQKKIIMKKIIKRKKVNYKMELWEYVQ